MTDPEKYRLLSVCYSFPPARVAAAIRMFYLHREFKAHFDSIHVISSMDRNLMEQDPDLVLPEIPVLDVRAWDPRHVWVRREGGRPTLPGPVKRNRLVRWVLRARDTFPLNIILGDGGVIYILRGYKMGSELVRKREITHLFTTFRPLSDHVIGWLLKWNFPYLVWIADIQDPPVDPTRRHVLNGPWQRMWFRFFLKRASILTTVSRGVKEGLTDWGPPVVVIHNWMPSSRVGLDSGINMDGSVFRVVYTGTIYPDHHRPQLLWQAIRRMIPEWASQGITLELHYAGHDDAIWDQWMVKHGLSNYSIQHGPLALTEVRRLQASATMNLLLTWSKPGQVLGILTSKLFDYLEAGRPILALVHGIMDPELNELVGQGHGLVITTEDEGAPEKFDAFVRYWTAKVYPPYRIDSGIRLKEEVAHMMVHHPFPAEIR
ncbi:MAG: hypothetical protein K9I85_05165 [Saprospiraceae bacterium]|nr:hypothetical protein [Saprospiraceae bacterium]